MDKKFLRACAFFELNIGKGINIAEDLFVRKYSVGRMEKVFWILIVGHG